ncbi:MAG: TRAP transporter substrate-binding protein DctP [Actinomycetaceae bacterium]|nr:TRAP transporter substrate-binding protein DctP [Actinomycetaceae bacterium]
MAVDTAPQAAAANWFFDELEKRTDGRVAVDKSGPEEICKAAEIAECVRDGRADIGVSVADYTAQLFPGEVIVSVPFLSDSSQQAVMHALHETHKQHQGSQAKWDDIGLHPVAHWPAGRLTLGSKAEIRNINDINGMKWRVAGPYLVKAFEEINGNPVSMPSSETYEALQCGVAEAAAFAIDGAVDYKLVELLPEWTDPGVGHYTTFGMWLNKDVYDGMSEEDRAIFDELAEEFNGGKGMELFAEGAADQCQFMLDHDNVAKFGKWDSTATKEWSDKVGDKLIEEWIAEAEKNGLADARSFYETYAKLVKDVTEADLAKDPVIACVKSFESR